MDALKRRLSVAVLVQVVARFSKCKKTREASVSMEEVGRAETVAAKIASEMMNDFILGWAGLHQCHCRRGEYWQ